MAKKKHIKAVALVSGGLDSALAIKLVLGQGIEVIALHFAHLFCQCALCVQKKRGKIAKKDFLKELGITPKVIDFNKELFELIKEPKHGFGANMNPCIDCHAAMLRKAKKFMLASGASFLVTGEVVGQRPMSQAKNTLLLIDKEAGVTGLVLRPLSAKVMPETLPEQKGLIDRSRLMDISGRTRKPQLELVKQYELKGHPAIAGGCLLTDSEFCRRLKDLLKYGGLNEKEVMLLKLGRHFRFSPDVKLVIGRDEQENELILSLKEDADMALAPVESAGPTGLLKGKFDQGHIDLSCSVIARYCDRKGKEKVKILLASQKTSTEKYAEPASDEKIARLKV